MTIIDIQSYTGKFKMTRLGTSGTTYEFVGKEKVPLTETGMLEVTVNLATIKKSGGRIKYIKSTANLSVTIDIITELGTYTYTKTNGQTLKFPMSNSSHDNYSIKILVNNSSAPTVKGVILKTKFVEKTETELKNTAPLITKTIQFNGSSPQDLGLIVNDSTTNNLNYVIHSITVGNDQDNGFIKFYDKRVVFANAGAYNIDPKFTYSVSILNSNNTVTYNPPHIFENGILVRAVNGTQQYYNNMLGTNSGINNSDGGIMTCGVSITYSILT